MLPPQRLYVKPEPLLSIWTARLVVLPASVFEGTKSGPSAGSKPILTCGTTYVRVS